MLFSFFSIIGFTSHFACAPEFPTNQLDDFVDNPEQDWDGDGQTENDGDCDDSNATVYLNAEEVCDNIDNDCNGTVDDDAIDAQDWYLDQDSDGFGLQVAQVYACDQPDRYVLKRINNTGDALFDCDDNDYTIFPGSTETCDGADNNCNGTIDEDVSLTFIADNDGDGFGDPLNPIDACTAPDNYILLTAEMESTGLYDCNDNSAAQHPDAEEICDDTDNDCDGLIDENVVLEQFLDNDGDGFGDPTARVEGCLLIENHVLNDADCNDDNPNQYPDAPEVCNLEDDDCDNQSDEGTDADAPIGSPTWYLDFDGDGVGTDSLSTIECYAPPNFVSSSGDCLDDDASVYPGAPEICDNIDQDCDGIPDNDPIAGVTFYADSDGDGDGDLYTTDIIQACYAYDPTTQQYLPPVGYVDIQGDCDDNNSSISSLEPELCTPIDENCDGSPTLGAIDQVEWFVDADGDNFGNPAFSIVSCPIADPVTNQAVAPIGYSENADDCDDLDGDLFPGNIEICNGKLDDCNAAEDADGDGIVEYSARSVEIDHDMDGFIECSFIVSDWVNPTTLPLGSGDCQPLDDDVFPGAPELCTGEVEDCLAADYGTTPANETDDDGDGYVECTGFIGIGWEGDPSVIGGNDCDDRSTDNNGDGAPDGIYTFPGAAELYPDALAPDLTFCVADQDENGLPDCTRMPNNIQQEAPAGYFCEYGIFLDTANLSPVNGPVGPDFVYIPFGVDPEGRYELTNSFYMMTTEVTREMYEALTGAQPSHFQSMLPSFDYPVENITWTEAAHFANLLSDQAQLERCYNENNDYAPFSEYNGANFYLCPGYRLPTEAEWEYAARSNVSLPYQYLGAGVWTPDGGGYISGSMLNIFIDDGVSQPYFSSYGWFAGNNIPDGPKPVSRLLPNGFGLYDLHGNVEEMVNDWATTSSPVNFTVHVFPNNGISSNGLLINPFGTPSGTIKVLRGGAFDDSDVHTLGFESSRGLYSSPTPMYNQTYDTAGFRLVRTDL